MIYFLLLRRDTSPIKLQISGGVDRCFEDHEAIYFLLDGVRHFTSSWSY